MSNDTQIQTVLATAVKRLLQPLVRLLLRHGVAHGAFADLAKQVYVDVAMSEFGIPGRKQSVSHTSIITGLSRKEVSRILKLDDDNSEAADERYNRAARVIAAWVREQDFTNEHGDPRTLPIDGEGSFSELVRRYSGDVPARAMLDELQRVGAVAIVDDRVSLKASVYVPESGEPEKIQILGQDVAGLISTIDHNLDIDKSPYFQRKVFYDNLPNEVIDELQALTRKHGQELIGLLDAWMAQHDRDENPSVEGTGRRRAGIGIYYFEE